MGYALRREVRDLLPRGGVLTDKESRLILELADSCGEETREGWPGAGWLAEKADIPNPKRVGEFFASIARKWVELRVPLGVDKHGQPYYSKPGQRTKYRFPAATKLGSSTDKVPPMAGPKVPVTEGPTVPPTPGARSPQQGDPSTQGTTQRTNSFSLSSDDEREVKDFRDQTQRGRHSIPSAVVAEFTKRSIGDDERGILIEAAHDLYKVRVPKAWWAEIISAGDFDAVLEKAGEHAALSSKFADPPWCGTCDEGTRLVDRSNGHTNIPVYGPCPRCHRTSVQNQQERSSERGYKPWRNPADQSVYDDWAAIKRPPEPMSTGTKRMYQALDVAAQLDEQERQARTRLPVSTADLRVADGIRLAQHFAEQDRIDFTEEET